MDHAELQAHIRAAHRLRADATAELIRQSAHGIAQGVRRIARAVRGGFARSGPTGSTGAAIG